MLKLNPAFDNHTVPIRPNLTERKPKLNPWFIFGVDFGFTREDSE